jgi:hypothetical protein
LEIGLTLIEFYKLMDKAIHKRIMIISISAIILFTLADFIGIGIYFKSNNELSYNLFGTWVAFTSFPLISIFISYSIFHPEKTRIRKAAKFALLAFPVMLAILVLCILSNNNILILIGAILMFVFTILALMHLFVFASPLSLTSTIVFLSLMIAGILLKRLHIPFASPMLTLSLGLFSIGCFMYGIRCLYLAEENRFLKYVMFLGNCVVTISLMGLLFKMQRWPGGDIMVNTGRVSIVLGTVVVLLLLPSSGFIDWQPLYKKILKRLIFPWALIFLLFIIRFLLPEVDAFIWERGTNRIITHGFSMEDYTIENKNNLKPEQVTEP